MRAVQYPSRYLLIQTICWNVCGVYTLKIIGNHIKDSKLDLYKVIVLAIAGVLAIIQTGIFMYTLSYRNRTVQAVEGHESVADALYLQVGTDLENLLTEACSTDADVDVVDCGYDGKWRNIEIENYTDSSVDILVPLFNFKYIEAFDAEGNELKLQQGDNNQYVLTVPAGFKDIVKIGFVEPVLWRISELVSVVSIIGMIIAGFLIKGKTYNGK